MLAYPEIGSWYLNNDSGEMFEVVALIKTMQTSKYNMSMAQSVNMTWTAGIYYSWMKFLNPKTGRLPMKLKRMKWMNQTQLLFKTKKTFGG